MAHPPGDKKGVFVELSAKKHIRGSTPRGLKKERVITAYVALAVNSVVPEDYLLKELAPGETRVRAAPGAQHGRFHYTRRIKKARGWSPATHSTGGLQSSRREGSATPYSNPSIATLAVVISVGHRISVSPFATATLCVPLTE